MKRSFTISIKEPCTQNWDEMSPDNAGRFCASCQKTVIDFTKFSDEELSSYFRQLEHFGCGRFTKKQLSVAIPQRPRRLTFWAVNKFAAASLVAALGLSFKAGAQVNIAPTHSVSERKVNNTIPEKITVIKGTVKDKNGEGIPGVSLRIKDTDNGTVSDINGRFQLELPQQDSICKLICKTIGMLTREIALNRNKTENINIIMENDNDTSTTTGVVYIVKTKPTLWQRLTKPFRKN